MISDAELVEHGTHDELIKRAGLYRQLYETQTGAWHRDQRHVRPRREHR